MDIILISYHIQQLTQNRVQNLSDLGFSKDFLSTLQKAQTIERIDKLHFIKIKVFYFILMFTAALVTVAERWKQSKYPLIDEWINKMWMCVYAYIRMYIKQNIIQL